MSMRDICAAASVPHTMRAGWLLGIIMYSLKKGVAALPGPATAVSAVASEACRTVRRLAATFEEDMGELQSIMRGCGRRRGGAGLSAAAEGAARRGTGGGPGGREGRGLRV